MVNLLTFSLLICASMCVTLSFFWLRWRTQTINKDLENLSDFEQREQRRLTLLKTKKQNIIHKIEARAQTRQDRDEIKSDDLDELNCRNEHLEQKLAERSTHQNERIDEMDSRRSEVGHLKSKVKSLKRRLKSSYKHIRSTLEQRAQLSSQEAIDTHLQGICAQVDVEVQQRTQRTLVEAEAYRDTRANELMSLGRQRYYDPSPAEKLLSFVELPRAKKQRDLIIAEDSEFLEMLQDVTQVSFVLEEPNATKLLLRNSPETYSREIARLTYQRWINGGELNEKSLRTHYQKSQVTLEKEARSAGLTAAKRLGLKGIHPEIMHLVGKLLFRTSYTQNQWQHAIEASELCGMMADELGMNVEVARRATLLHDIGKVLWAETEAVGSHAVSGAAFAREFGEVPEIIHPIGAHHHDEQPSSALAFLVIAADTLSGARPGARRESSEAFSQHVAQLDELCETVDGLRQHMIIQGGREVRLQVYPQKYSDLDLTELTEEMASVIEDQCVFPGQIKVTALRELITTAVAQARSRDRRQQTYRKDKENVQRKHPLRWGGERGEVIS